MDQVHNMRKILIKGILHKSSETIRKLIEDFAYFLAANVHPSNTPLSELPLEQFLVSYLDTTSLLTCSTNCEALYELLTILVGHYKQVESGEKVLDLNKKFKELTEYLGIVASSDDSKAEITDATLSGLLNLANAMVDVKEHADSLPLPKRLKSIEQIFAGCLFPSKTSRYICRSPESRQVAYKFISSLLQCDAKCWQHLLTDCVLPLREKVKELDVWLYNPGTHECSKFGYVGLKNIGCICYINAMLQQFFMIPPFRNSIASICDGKAPKIGENGIDDNLLHQLQRLFIHLMKSKRKDYNPVAFCYSFKESDGKPTNTAVQHDAQEFLNILFERLETIFKDSPYKYITQSIFGGKLCSQVICSGCGYISSTYEDYYTLSLEIKNQHTLEESLGKFIVGNTVSEYQCSCCRKKVDATKRTLISTLPNVLIIYLQRFTFNFDTLTNEKIHTRLAFPKILDMTHYTEEGSGDKKEADQELSSSSSPSKILEAVDERQSEVEIQTKEAAEIKTKEASDIKRKDPNSHAKESSEDEKSKAEDEKDVKESPRDVCKALKEKDYYTYKLVGIVVHNGNAESGHYYSYINTNRGECESAADYLKPEEDAWLEFNDSIISSFGFSRLEEECFGGSSEEARMGYMGGSEIDRLIERRSKSAYMLVYERKSKGMIPLKVDEVPEGGVILSNLDCGNTAPKAERVYGKDKNNDLYELHSFHNVPCSISKDLLEEVEGDNERFLYERLIYDSEFISFLCSAFAVTAKDCSEELHSLLYRVVDDFFFDVFAHTSFPNTLSSSIDSIVEVIKVSPDNSRKLVSSFIAKPERMFNLLVRCPEVAMRVLVQKSITVAAVCISGKDDEMLMKLVDALMGIVGYDLSMQWTRFGQFFEVLRDVVGFSSPAVLHYGLAKDIVTPLLDFFLGRDSPVGAKDTKRYEMGNSAQAADFGPLMSLVSRLVASSELPEQPKEVDESGEMCRVKLSETAQKCIKCDAFVPRYLKCNGKIDYISSILIYLCKGNKKFSKKMCKTALKEVNSYERAKTPQNFDLIFKLLAIEDQYQLTRLEWILGHSHPIQNYNYGLNAISDIRSDVNAYDSFLLSGTRDKCLLQLMWNYQRYHEDIVLWSFKQLLELANANKIVYEYLRDMPAPNYLYERYTDWVPEFLGHYAKSCSYATVSRPEKEDMLADTLTEYQLFSQQVLKDAVTSPQRYMVGKVVDSRKLDERAVELGDVRMSVTEVVAEVYESRPTGEYNAGVTGEYLKSYFRHYTIRNKPSSAHQKKEDNSKKEERKEIMHEKDIGTDSNSVACAKEEGKGEAVNEKDEPSQEKLNDNNPESAEKADAQEEQKVNSELHEANLPVKENAGAELVNDSKEIQELALDPEKKLQCANEVQADSSKEQNATQKSESMQDNVQHTNAIEENANSLKKDGDEEVSVAAEENIPLKREEETEPDNKKQSTFASVKSPLEDGNKEATDTNSNELVEKAIKEAEVSKEEQSAGINKTKEDDKELLEEEKEKAIFRPLVVFHRIEISNNIHFDRTVKLTIRGGADANFYVPRCKLSMRVSKFETQVYHIQKNSPEKDFGDYTLELCLAKQKEPTSVFSPSTAPSSGEAKPSRKLLDNQ